MAVDCSCVLLSALEPPLHHHHHWVCESVSSSWQEINEWVIVGNFRRFLLVRKAKGWTWTRSPNSCSQYVNVNPSCKPGHKEEPIDQSRSWSSWAFTTPYIVILAFSYKIRVLQLLREWWLMAIWIEWKFFGKTTFDRLLLADQVDSASIAPSGTMS